MLTSANTSRTGRSVLEAPSRESVIHFQELGLAGRLLAPQREEANLVGVEIHFTAHQAVGPHLAERPGPPQQSYFAEAAAAPQVDQPAARPVLQVQLPVGGESPAVWRRLQPRRPLLTQRLDVPPRAPLQALQVGVLEARPDPGLPPAVVA